MCPIRRTCRSSGCARSATRSRAAPALSPPRSPVPDASARLAPHAGEWRTAGGGDHVHRCEAVTLVQAAIAVAGRLQARADLLAVGALEQRRDERRADAPPLVLRD